MEGLAPARAIERASLLDRYQPLIGVRATERLLKKARRRNGLKVLHVNSTRQGGGVAEILSSHTPLMNDIGIEAEWLVIAACWGTRLVGEIGARSRRECHFLRKKAPRPKGWRLEDCTKGVPL